MFSLFSQSLIHHLWLGLSLEDAVGQARLHHQLYPNNIFFESKVPKVQQTRPKMYQVGATFICELIFCISDVGETDPGFG